jgi:hypothetical protein
VAGPFGYRFGPEGKTSIGRVLDRQFVHDMPMPLPAEAHGLDEIVLAVRRDTSLRFDPSLRFHLYGADICLAARARGLAVAVLDAPCLHNSLFAYLSPQFHTARNALLAKWPEIRPLYSSMGRLDGMEPQPVPGTWVDAERDRRAELERELAEVQARLEDRLRHVANMEASVFWKLRDLAHRVLRRR